MSEQPKRSMFRKYAATIMASAVVAGIIASWVSGAFTTPEEGLTGGMIVGLAAKFLWEENAS